MESNGSNPPTKCFDLDVLWMMKNRGRGEERECHLDDFAGRFNTTDLTFNPLLTPKPDRFAPFHPQTRSPSVWWPFEQAGLTGPLPHVASS